MNKYEDIDIMVDFAKRNNMDIAICFKTNDIKHLIEIEAEHDITVVTMDMDIVDKIGGVMYVDLNERK